MKILYIEKDVNVRDIYVMKLDADFHARIVEVETVDAAKEALKTAKDFAFVLSDDPFRAEKDGRPRRSAWSVLAPEGHRGSTPGDQCGTGNAWGVPTDSFAGRGS